MISLSHQSSLFELAILGEYTVRLRGHGGISYSVSQRIIYQKDEEEKKKKVMSRHRILYIRG